MKKLNNRGFAISTLLYGLMIMSLLIVFALFGNLSTNRKSTVTFVDKVEDELNRLGSTNTGGSHEGGAVDEQGREYIAPDAGWYKIELWGASGPGGKGSYVSGIMYLETNDYLLFYVGAAGGGGNTFNSGTTGGGATDVRLLPGEWNDEESMDSRIMVAAGGGSSGNGGAISGHGNNPGTQTIVKASSSGGGGYAGSTSNGGGSSYIAGYAGVRSSTGENVKKYKVHRGEYTETGDPIYEDYTPVIYNGLMISGVHTGAGKFRVGKVSENDISNPPRKGSNSKLNNVMYIRDCVTGSSSGTSVANWLEIQAIKDGNRQKLTYVNSSGGTLPSDKVSIVNDGKADVPGSYATINGSGKKCITYKLDSIMNLDEIAVWHNYSNSNTSSRVTGHELSVSSNNSNWVMLRKMSSDTSTIGQQNEYETSDGIHYNSLQYDSTEALPDGNYYIFSSESHNRVLTLQEEAGDQGYVAVLKEFTGDDNQMWRVYKNGGYYHLQNPRYMKDFIVLNSDNTLVLFNNPDFSADNQNISITPLGNGYYTISPYNNSNLRVTLGDADAIYTKGLSNTHSQRWKFVMASY